jgi:hypothetical protein
MWQHGVVAHRICRSDANRSRDDQSTDGDLEKTIYMGFSPTGRYAGGQARQQIEGSRTPKKHQQIDATRIGVVTDYYVCERETYFRT